MSLILSVTEFGNIYPMSRTLARTDTKAEEDASTLVNNSKSNTHRKPISKTSSTYKQHHTNAKEARLVSSDRKRQARIPAPIIALKSSTTLPSPISILGAGRTDPFARYPVASSRKVECYDLVDHCEFLRQQSLCGILPTLV